MCIFFNNHQYSSMKTFSLLLAAFFICSSICRAQISITGDFLSYIDSSITAMPSGIGTNEYTNPNSTQGKFFGKAVEDCFVKKYSDADSVSALCGYEVVAFTDTASSPHRIYYILRRDCDSLNHWGTFVFNPSPLRASVVIQSPHELFDTKTAARGHLFSKNFPHRHSF